MATQEGTWAYRDRFHEQFARTFFRSFDDLALSSIGIGTYLGDPTDAVDEDYREAVVEALESGVNVVDTSINYRHQRSERAVGEALEQTDVPREDVFVATKGGFVPFEREHPVDPAQFVFEEYVQTGIIDRGHLVQGSHCITPPFIDDQFDRSRENLGVDTIDCYYVHNPETQLESRSQEAVYDHLEATFTRLEERVQAGDLRCYGVATWDAFRVDHGAEKYLSAAEILRRARAAADAAGAESTHFRAIQLPFNVGMADAFTVDAHEGPTGLQSVLEFAHQNEIGVFTSASLLQGHLLETFPAAVEAELSGDTRAQRAINFARSGPGVTAALVGMASAEHVRENVAAGTFEPLGARTFDAIFE
jgi:aryl-alcohol dehydrogenase-like predicted oxidoreductase